MSERFFVSPPIAGDRARLTGDEARHLAAVMRAEPGDQIVLFDGSGAEFIGRIEGLGKQTVELAIVERRQVSRELPFQVTLAVALPKGERQKWLIEKATELGVTRLVPLAAERGVAQPTNSAVERLRRGVVEASKQCGRNMLMEVAPAMGASDYFASAEALAERFIADPGGEPIAAVAGSKQSALIAAIGPEGGFTPDEVAAARRAGWRSVSLGSRILRVETAAIAVAAWAALSRAAAE